MFISERRFLLMARRDGTGPLGEGPRSGRGMGTCNETNPVNRPFQYGTGYGRASGNASGRGRGLGRGNGRNRNMGSK